MYQNFYPLNLLKLIKLFHTQTRSIRIVFNFEKIKQLSVIKVEQEELCNSNFI